MTPRYHVQAYDYELALTLEPRLSLTALEEACRVRKMPLQLMILGASLGPTYMVMDYEQPIGIFGGTHQGVLWAFFAEDLALGAHRAIRRQARGWVKQLLRETGREFLINRVHQNYVGIHKWLRTLECIDLWEDAPYDSHIPFITSVRNSTYV